MPEQATEDTVHDLRDLMLSTKGAHVNMLRVVEKAIRPNTKMVSKGGIQSDTSNPRRDFSCNFQGVLLILV